MQFYTNALWITCNSTLSFAFQFIEFLSVVLYLGHYQNVQELVYNMVIEGAKAIGTTTLTDSLTRN